MKKTFLPTLRLLCAVAVMLITTRVSHAASGTPGELDLSFEADSSIDGAISTVLQNSDGKVLIGGGFSTVNGVVRRGIARLDTEGTFDNTFAEGLPGISSPGWVRPVAVQPDGKILIGGNFSSVHGETRNNIARLNSDGTLDEAFGRGLAGADSVLYAILVQDNGKILIGGAFSSIHGVTRNGIAQLNANGSLDTGFADGLEGVSTSVSAFAVQSDGKILIGGPFQTIHGQTQPYLARLHPDGTLDASFAQGLEGPNNAVKSVLVQPDGRILVGGIFTSVHGQPLAYIARLNSDGTVDDTFALNLPGPNAWVESVALQENGKIVIGGHFEEVHGTVRNRIARLRPDGTLDVDFGAGLAGVNGDSVLCVSLQNDGEILLAGHFSSVNGVQRHRVARLHGDPPPPNQAPTEILLSDSSIPHNHPRGMEVGRLTAVDPDDDAHTFTLVDGEGDEHNSFFAIEGDALETAAAFDGHSSYTIRVRATDPQGLYLEETFTITVEPNQAPTEILLSNSSVPENWPIGTEVGRLTAVDPDKHDGHTFTLVPGEGDEGNAAFTIHDRALITAAVIDHEFQDSYLIRVRATDAGGHTVEEAFVVTVTTPAPPLPWPGETHPAFDPGLSADGVVLSTALQDDGKWIIAGGFSSINGTSRNGIARLNANGSLDASFLDGLAGADNSIDSVAILSDGKLVIGGSFTTFNGEDRRLIARLNADGTLDSSFAEGLPGPSGSVRSLQVQEDGKILIGGIFSSVNGEPRGRIARLNANGSLDPTFGDGLAGADSEIGSIALQSDGKILIAGNFSQVNGIARTGIARLNPDGSTDVTFSTSVDDRVRSVAIQSDGKILIGGKFSSVEGTTRNRIARINDDGTLDENFGQGLAGANQTEGVLAIALQQDGKILIGGDFTSVNGQQRLRIARLNPDGTLDEAFGDGLSGANSWVRTINTDPPEKLLIGGFFTSVNGLPRNRIALLQGGQPPANVHPTDLLLTNNSVVENEPIGTTVGTLSAEDPDENDPHTFTLGSVEGDEDNASFTIDGDRLKTAAVFDHASQSSYSIRIRAVDAGGLWVKRTLTVIVEPDPSPTDILLSNESVLENRPAGTTVGNLTAIDPDENDAHTFSLINGEGDGDNASFSIDDDALKTAAVFDYDTQSSYSIRIRATDSEGRFVEKTFTIVVELNQAPTDILLSSDTVPENWPQGTPIGSFTAIDSNHGDTHTFALASGEGDDGNGSFTIDGDVLRTAAIFDHEIQDSYSIRIRSTDADGLSTEKVFALTVITPPPPVPVPGEVDPAFDPGLSIEGGNVQAVVSHGDGKWLIGGYFTTVNGQARGGIARLNANGSLDETFMNELAGTNSSVHAIAVQPDGKILIGGFFTTVNGSSRWCIARLHTDGSLDDTFGNSLVDSTVRSIALQSDGKILIGGGFTSVDGETRNRIARLNADGSLDDTFGDGLAGASSNVYSVVLQSDGKVLIAGSFVTINESSQSLIARLEEDGTLDSTFAAEVTGSNIQSMTLQEDGRILIGGTFTSVNGTVRNRIARLEADGMTDLAFGDGLAGANSTVSSMAVQADGKILIGGAFTAVNGTVRTRIGRLNEDGTLDDAFGKNQTGANHWVNSIALRDEKILIGGAFTVVNGLARERVALLHGGEQPANQAPTNILLSGNWVFEDQPAGSIVGSLSGVDPDAEDSHTFELTSGDGDTGNAFFTIEDDTLKTAAVFDSEAQSTYSIRVRAMDAAGLFVKKNFTITIYPIPGDEPGDVDLSFNPGSINGTVLSVAQQNDGKWIIGGHFTSIGGKQRGRIARLNADGTLDPAFGDGLSGASASVSAVAVQQDGKILLVGGFSQVNGEPRSRIARLHEDGTLDHTFQASVTSRTGPAAIVPQSDGKILIGGYVLSVNGEAFNGIARVNEDGSLDEGFVPQLPAFRWEVASIAVYDDGRIVVGGTSQSDAGGPDRSLARLNPDGSLDRTFEVFGRIESVAIQDDRRILIGGLFTSVDGQSRNRIARLNMDGSLDNSFGEGMTGVEGTRAPRVRSLALQPTGKVIIGGDFTTVNGESRNRIALLNPDGTLDDTFGAGMAGANDIVHAVAPRGLDVLLAGSFTLVNGIPRERIALLQGGNQPPTDLLLAGDTISENRGIGTTVGAFSALDPNEGDTHTFTLVNGEGDEGNLSFTVEGNELKTAALIDYEEADSYTIRVRATDLSDAFVESIFSVSIVPAPDPMPLPSDVDLSFAPGISIDGTVRAVMEQSDGKVLIAGEFTSVNGQTRNRIARLNPDGSLDTSFGHELAGADNRIFAMAELTDGKILIGGYFVQVNGVMRRHVARLHSDGSLDETFGTPEDGLNAPVLSIARQPDGKILIGGIFTAFNNVTRNRIARLNPDGTLDASFGQNLSGANDWIHSIAIHGDGKITIGGRFTTINHVTRNRLARLHLDGTTDDTFGDESSGADRPIFSLALQEDGKLLIGGAFVTVHGETRNRIARLNTDGSLDTAFTSGENGPVMAIALQEDGRAVLGGAFPMGGITRLRTNGTRDPTFDTGATGANNWVHAVALQRDGKILIGGSFTSVNDIERNRAARLHGGAPAPTNAFLSNRSVPENQAAGTIVGNLSAVDLDPEETHSFVFVSGEGSDGNASFNLDGDILRTAAVFDAEQQDIYTIRIRASNAKGLWVKRSFTITIEQDLYLAWAEQLPEGHRGPNDDPCGYGIQNLLRYAFGMDALQPEREKMPQLGQRALMEDGKQQTYLTLTYTRRTDDSSLTYTAEASDQLMSWAVFDGAEEITDDGNGETETVTVIDSEPIEETTRRFLRVGVER